MIWKWYENDTKMTRKWHENDTKSVGYRLFEYRMNRMEAYLGHEGAPEVVEEEVGDGRVRSNVFVVFDGRYVVEHEAALRRVPEGHAGHRRHQHVRQRRQRRDLFTFRRSHPLVYFSVFVFFNYYYFDSLCRLNEQKIHTATLRDTFRMFCKRNSIKQTKLT